ncbi:MAG TPA: LuxR C-terminal-related transcriptional regulator [Acidimicrobiales bacterium]|nr:LuxR C-terminal-related transcriptional regulator [Acidimicrobiales bacterium]
MASPLERARAAYARQAWGDAFAAFDAIGEDTSAGPADHEARAVCAYLLGKDGECARSWEAAHRSALEAGATAEAARYGFWLALCLMLEGRMAQAGGWLTRTERLVGDGRLDCAASGYLLIPALLAALDQGDAKGARDLAVRATGLGVRFGDADLRAFATLGHGQALIALGDIVGGTARLDDVMVSVTAGEVGPITTGIVYCAVVLECMKVFDLQRAAEWTGALSAWCEAQPDLVPYRGQCLVHRSQLDQATGDWRAAISTAGAACARLTDPPHPALGLAHYQEAELHRLTGALADAEAGYRRASRHGYEPMPGLALLKLAQGDAMAAAATMQRALGEAGASLQRTALLFAAVEVLTAAEDLSGARAAAVELERIAAASPSAVVTAMAAQAAGTVLVADGDPAAALVRLRSAASAWQALHMPYDAARAATLVGVACAALGDHLSTALELDNATESFSALGAVPDVERVAALRHSLVNATAPATATRSPIQAAPALSTREREVLAQVAAGRTNRQIAAELFISEHTVGRHVENIFTKLGVTSRAAATAYAYERRLL